MDKIRKVLILSDTNYNPVKMYLDQMLKLAKGFIRLGHDVRHISYSGLLSQLSPFKSRTLSACFYEKKVDRQIAQLAAHYQPDIVYISFARVLNAETITTVRNAVPKVVFIGGDGDPWPKLQGNRIETAKKLDILMATNDGEFLQDYREAGVPNCMFMPNLCDPDTDHRYEVPEQWNTDILWTGKAVSKDGEIVESPRQNFAERPPPSKMDFFPFWLGTFTLCLELTWCVRADVFEKCFPEFETSDYFLQNHAIFGFNYNFNVNGYLSFFLPVYACYGREHQDSKSVNLRDFNGRMKQQYKAAVTKYGNELFSGARRHVFRDGKSNVINELRPDELDSCRKKVLHYRINRRFYKCKKSVGIIHHWSRKLKILALYFLLRKRIYY